MALPKTAPIPSAGNPSGPSFNHALAVTPNDGADLPHVVTGFIVTPATTGNTTVKVDTAGGETGVTLTVAPGTYIPLRCTRIYATGLSAGSSVVGFYN
jgi:hypothetical protein